MPNQHVWKIDKQMTRNEVATLNPVACNYPPAVNCVGQKLATKKRSQKGWRDKRRKVENANAVRSEKVGGSRGLPKALSEFGDNGSKSRSNRD